MHTHKPFFFLTWVLRIRLRSSSLQGKHSVFFSVFFIVVIIHLDHKQLGEGERGLLHFTTLRPHPITHPGAVGRWRQGNARHLLADSLPPSLEKTL